jgi:hypothetical protein
VCTREACHHFVPGSHSFSIFDWTRGRLHLQQHHYFETFRPKEDEESNSVLRRLVHDGKMVI